MYEIVMFKFHKKFIKKKLWCLTIFFYLKKKEKQKKNMSHERWTSTNLNQSSQSPPFSKNAWNWNERIILIRFISQFILFIWLNVIFLNFNCFRCTYICKSNNPIWYTPERIIKDLKNSKHFCFFLKKKTLNTFVFKKKNVKFFLRGI